MEIITKNTIMGFDAEHEEILNSASDSVATLGFILSNRDGHAVSSYVELLTKVATLSYYNSRFQLLFRGQSADYKTGSSANTSDKHPSDLYPSILRKYVSKQSERKSALDRDFELLKAAELLLVEHIQNRDLFENQIIRWAILQHYGVCKTPLLDVTASLQIALTFAIGDRNEGWLYVLAFPQLSGGVSVSIESKTQVINLSQICPPEALRPHFQKGLLASEYPEIRSREQSHGRSGKRGNNFSARLLTKFKLENCQYWNSEGFTPTPDNILFPNVVDPWFELTQRIREKIHA